MTENKLAVEGMAMPQWNVLYAHRLRRQRHLVGQVGRRPTDSGAVSQQAGPAGRCGGGCGRQSRAVKSVHDPGLEGAASPITGHQHTATRLSFQTVYPAAASVRTAAAARLDPESEPRCVRRRDYCNLPTVTAD
jgi:hypothetical protein